MSFKRILVAVDAEPIAARAIDVAIDSARSLGAELARIHAVDPSLGACPTPSWHDEEVHRCDCVSVVAKEGGPALL